MTSSSSTCEDVVDNSSHRPLHVLLGVTGSVAAVKSPEIAVQLVRQKSFPSGIIVKVLLTQGGRTFWNQALQYNAVAWDEFEKEIVKKRIVILDAEKEWHDWKKLGDPVLHIDLRNWADLLLVAPLSAHTLAKVAHGLSDDTLSCVIRAWEFGRGSSRANAKPLLLAPAMNTAMWVHVLTNQQLETIRGFFTEDDANAFHVIEPQTKLLACGEFGDGALAEVADIVKRVVECGVHLSSYANVRSDE